MLCLRLYAETYFSLRSVIHAFFQAEILPKATLTHRQWHLNYGHSIAESVFEAFNLACAYLQSCDLSTTDLVPVFIDRPGTFGWTGAKGNWKTVLPPAADALQCFFPRPALWIADTAIHSRVSKSTCIPDILTECVNRHSLSTTRQEVQDALDTVSCAVPLSVVTLVSKGRFC